MLSIELFACNMGHVVKNAAIKYGLFFVTHHELGADKFLEAQHKLRKWVAKGQTLSLDFESSDNTNWLRDVLKQGSINNTELYRKGLVDGIYCTEIRKQCKQMEDSGELVVEELSGMSRNSKGFYLGYREGAKIRISMKEKLL